MHQHNVLGAFKPCDHATAAGALGDLFEEGQNPSRDMSQ